jgi:hypothetical protein
MAQEFELVMLTNEAILVGGLLNGFTIVPLVSLIDAVAT